MALLRELLLRLSGARAPRRQLQPVLGRAGVKGGGWVCGQVPLGTQLHSTFRAEGGGGLIKTIDPAASVIGPGNVARPLGVADYGAIV